MTDTSVISIMIDPSQEEIIGVVDGHLYLKTIYQKNDEDFFDYDDLCVAIISKELYAKMFNLWLDAKQQYCTSWGSFCGVGGFFYSKELKYLSTMTITTEWNAKTKDLDTKIVPVFEIIEMDMRCDMEHG